MMKLVERFVKAIEDGAEALAALANRVSGIEDALKQSSLAGRDLVNLARLQDKRAKVVVEGVTDIGAEAIGALEKQLVEEGDLDEKARFVLHLGRRFLIVLQSAMAVEEEEEKREVL